MNIGALIFARMDSTRLPGKALLDLCGRPLLGRVLDRVRRVRPELPIVLATTDCASDDPIAAFAREENVGLYRGARDDVAGRAVAAARAHTFDAFVRVCGDRPFCDPRLIETLRADFEREGADLATNALTASYPKGLMTEVVRTATLEEVLRDVCTDAEDREHVTRYFYQHPERYIVIGRQRADTTLASLNLALDTTEDAQRTIWMIERLLPDPAAADFELVVRLARDWQAGHVTEILRSAAP